jgi:hypothetical protein
MNKKYLRYAGIGFGSGSIFNPALGPGMQNLLSLSAPELFFQVFIPNLITLLLILGSLWFFFMLISGAIRWIGSEGDKAGIQMARDQIINAFIGFFLLLSVFAVLQVLEVIFGIKLMTIDLTPLFIK